MYENKTAFALFSIALLVIFAGCSAFGPSGEAGTSTPEVISSSTSTPGATPTPKETVTPEQTVTPEVTTKENTKTATDKYAERRKKYNAFDNVSKGTHSSFNISVIDSNIYPKNKTYTYIVEIQGPQNETRNVEIRQYIAIIYLQNVEYLNSNKEDGDHTWVPDTVNVTLVTPEGEVFETGYLKYIWAYKTYTGEWSNRIYLAHYAGSIEDGPAKSDG